MSRHVHDTETRILETFAEFFAARTEAAGEREIRTFQVQRKFKLASSDACSKQPVYLCLLIEIIHVPSPYFRQKRGPKQKLGWPEVGCIHDSSHTKTTCLGSSEFDCLCQPNLMQLVPHTAQKEQPQIDRCSKKTPLVSG